MLQTCLQLQKWILLFILTTAPRMAAAQAHCILRHPVPDLLTLGIYAGVEEIRTEYYSAYSHNGKWVADSLLYTRVACFNSQGFYSQVTELYPDFRTLCWTYQYQDRQLSAIICDRNGYKRDMQTVRWIDDYYCIRFLYPFDVRQNIFRMKPESSEGQRFSKTGQPEYCYQAAADTCDKISETRFLYLTDTIRMYTFDFSSNQERYHTIITLDKDDCGNPLQRIRNRETTPVMEFSSYRYFRD